MLEVVGLTAGYFGGKKPVLNNLNLCVPGGSTLALLGASGSGKSTLLRVLAGLENINAGQIIWQGKDITAVPAHKRNFGMVFQDAQLFAHRSVSENIEYGLRVQRKPKKQRQQTVAQMLDLVSLTGYGARTVSSLSGGQAQRVALARALAPEPQLLLLDEPLSALDTDLRLKLGHELKKILASRTAIFVTHDEDEANRVADQVIRLENLQQ